MLWYHVGRFVWTQLCANVASRQRSPTQREKKGQYIVHRQILRAFLVSCTLCWSEGPSVQRYNLAFTTFPGTTARASSLISQFATLPPVNPLCDLISLAFGLVFIVSICLSERTVLILQRWNIGEQSKDQDQARECSKQRKVCMRLKVLESPTAKSWFA